MKESYEEDLGNRFGLQRRADCGNNVVLSVRAEGHAGQLLNSEAFYDLKKAAAVGGDGMTWHEYEQDLETNVTDLHDRIHRGAYRAQPSRPGREMT